MKNNIFLRSGIFIQCARIGMPLFITCLAACSGGGGSTATPNSISSGKIIDNEDKSPGLKGPDVNGNGIRDDIDRLISNKYAKTPVIQLAAEQEARALQRNLEATTRAEALRVGDAIMRAGSCTAKVLPRSTPEQFKYWESMSKDIEALTINTEERFTAYWRVNRLMTGAVFHQAAEPVCD